MSEQINSGRVPRDYGATSSTSNIPDVSFSTFSPTEFMYLEENISAIKSGTKQIDKMLKLIQSNQGQQNIFNRAHEVLTNTNQCIEATTNALHRSTKAATQRGDKQQKLQLNKITDDFKDVVSKYSAVENEIVVAIKNVNMRLRKLEQQRSVIDSEQNLLLEQQQLTKQQQAEEREIEMLAERERQLVAIQKDLIDVTSVMEKLSTMVVIQGTQVDVMERNVENAAIDVEIAARELAKADRSTQRHRCKILILIIVAVIIGLIVTGVIISSFK